MKERAINKYLPADYQDTFSLEVEGNKLSPKEIILKIFSHDPAWLLTLFKIRGWLVKPFGIETTPIPAENCIIENSEQEAIMRKDDKHLLFYIDVFIEPIGAGIQQIDVTTLVKHHNWLGKTYFFFIKPFHRIIVPMMLKRILKRGCQK